MKLRTKTLLLISLSLLSLIGVLYSSLSVILLQSFAQLETQNTERDVRRVEKALAQELSQLGVTNKDWSHWDATYQFFLDQNEEYIAENLEESTFLTLQLNLVLMITIQGKVIFSQGFDLGAEETVEVSSHLLQKLDSNHRLIKQSSLNSSVQGLWKVDDKIILVSAYPVLTSGHQGPIKGVMIMGRYLNQARIKKIAEQTQLIMNFYLIDSDSLSQELQAIVEKLRVQEQDIFVQILDQNNIAGYRLLNDIENDNQVLLEVRLQRDIYQEGQRALRYLIASLFVVGGVFGGLTVVLLEKLVLARLARLSNAVEAVGESHDLTLRVPMQGSDELSELGQSINGMLTQLEQGAAELAREREKVERLLLNVLPESIADRLKKDEGAFAQRSEGIAEFFEEVTILFADIVGFAPLSLRLPPVEVVNLLNEIFSAFDAIAQRLGLEKIKTIGDAYMVAGGLPTPRPDHAEAIAEMALGMLQALDRFQGYKGETFQIRVGINTGVVVAGVIGTQKFMYDLWGDTVNVAARMESHGEPGKIQVTEATYERLKGKYELEERGMIALKGRGEMLTYWLNSRCSLSRS
ncbi:adenylate/guanylate cyclase domain-containing protein [Spirulina subsalsa]|uniref:adenylate/guanylate cyclase domain-containing protein n=1 Tax=Spirulina subsalsa TaxID=54311 RepID=UPI00030704C8|nr:adenylate/guanylate cyclase domain-containing protein [Spirulina subsalsa]